MKTVVRFSCEQYHEMIRLGLFEPREKHHVELIFGRIVPIRGKSRMCPIDPEHINTLAELNEWSFEVLPRKAAIVSIQGPISIPGLKSEPEPDLVWVAPRKYKGIKYQPADVLLLIEVSDSSLAKDRGKKSRLYATAGIRDYWIIDLNNQRIEVRRDPVGSHYQSIVVYEIGEEVHPLAFPDASLPVARIFAD